MDAHKIAINYYLRELDFSNYTIQLIALMQLGFSPEKPGDPGDIISFASEQDAVIQGKILLIPGRGVIFFDGNSLVDVFSPIMSEGILKGYKVNQGKGFKFYTVDKNFLMSCDTEQVLNGLSIDGSFSSPGELCEAVEFYYKNAMNQQPI